MDAIEACVSGLFGTLGIAYMEVPFSLSSARSSFLKAIDKLPPSDKTQEFKDGVLWADCVELLQRDDVCLVSADKAFYMDREYGKGLAENLKAELAGASHTFSVFSALDELVRGLQLNVIVEDDTLTSAYLAAGSSAINGLLERNGFVLGERLSVIKTVFATENPRVVYVEFSIVFEAMNAINDVRENGSVTFKGDGAYNLDDHTMASLRRDEEALEFNEPSGEHKSVRNVYAFSHAFLGHKEVNYSVRKRLL